MERLVTSDFRLGIIGGGQLGKLLALAASNWDVRTHVLDPDADCPASVVSNIFTQGDIRDYDTVYRFGKSVNMVTIEIENINLDALKALKKEGILVYPEPEILETIKDKGVQKDFFRDNGFPAAGYHYCDSPQEIRECLDSGKIRIPFVQKLRVSGYDGRGVKIIRKEEDMKGLLQGLSIVEDFIEAEKEISLIVTRSTRNEVSVYPPVEMVFRPEANILDYQVSPARLSDRIARESAELAHNIALKLGITGLLAVEMFLDKEGKLYINELAPRPHNSGHHTIESAYTSQYEQHLRALFGFPLGSTRLKTPSVMMNLLGDEGFSGPAHYQGLTDSLGLEGVKIHIYGKRETRPYRKMGHATILDRTIDDAIDKVAKLKKILQVRSV